MTQLGGGGAYGASRTTAEYAEGVPVSRVEAYGGRDGHTLGLCWT